jgi:hypothetical protein
MRPIKLIDAFCTFSCLFRKIGVIRGTANKKIGIVGWRKGRGRSYNSSYMSVSIAYGREEETINYLKEMK